MKKSLKISLIAAAGVLGAALLSFSTLTGIRTYKIASCEEAEPLSDLEKLSLDVFLTQKYQNREQLVSSLPYNFKMPELDIGAKSAIIIDSANGNIVYEKNADEVIPPASMTKLFCMYVVDDAISSGRFSYEDIIPLPPESWACNMPPHSSLMFLGEGQSVTLEELLQGLSVASGNDAAYALAYTVSGSMEAFIEKMNDVAKQNNLLNTRFVESSGYSELNTTTSREMAAFSRLYLSEHPLSLKKFHGLQSFTYPKEHNLAQGDKLQAQDFSQGLPRHITMPITQRNTNPLLGVLDGCDGLKTGYIDESGYNLSLTAIRNGTRFISVTMGGPGSNAREGNQWRVHDGTELMEYAFANFASYTDMSRVKPYFVRAAGTKTTGLNLLPAFNPKAVTVPFIYGDSVYDSLENVQVVTNLPSRIEGDILPGTVLGSVDFILDGHLLDSVPLVSDREIKKANLLVRLSDKIVFNIIELRSKN